LKKKKGKEVRCCGSTGGTM